AGRSAVGGLRVEGGVILLQAEFTRLRNAFSDEQEYSPSELGLGRLVDLVKDRFVGKKALMAEHAGGGPARRLVGMEHDWRGVEAAFARHGLPTVLVLGTSREPAPVHGRAGRVGKATSTTWS